MAQLDLATVLCCDPPCCAVPYRHAVPFLTLCAVNRRMDEWVTMSQLDLATVEVDATQDGPDGK